MKCPKNAKRFASKMQNGLHKVLNINHFANLLMSPFLPPKLYHLFHKKSVNLRLLIVSHVFS